MSLLDQYKTLLIEYDKVLNLSQRILAELKRGREGSDFLILQEQKEALVENITRLVNQIASKEIKNKTDPDLRNLPEIKSLLHQITEKAELIQKVEEEIRRFF